MLERYDLLVLGDVNPDLIVTGDVVPRFAQAEQVLDGAALLVGGSGAITACAAARLGLRVAICGVIGEDLFGAFMRSELEDRGVDTSGLRVDPAAATGLTVVLSRADDRSSLTFPGTIASLTAEHVDPGLLRSARHVHVSQYFMQTALQPSLPALFDEAHAAGATTSVDPNADPADRWDSGLPGLLPRVDVFLPNATEAAAIANTDDLERAARALGAGTVVVKDGAAGALAVRGDQIVRAVGFPVDTVDATGAGDTFDAGFLTAHLAGLPLDDALRFANACGALSTRALGGVAAQPDRDDVDALLAASP